MAKVNASFEAFLKGMLKDRTSAEKKRKIDKTRDHQVSGFMKVVFEENHFPNKDAAVITSHTELLKVVNKYGLKIIRLSRIEETTAIDNMFADIDKIDITPLIPTGITRWIPVIEASNAAYKGAAYTYISDSTQVASTKSATDLAPALEHDLEELYAMLYATIKRTPSDVLKKAYAELETLIDSVK